MSRKEEVLYGVPKPEIRKPKSDTSYLNAYWDEVNRYKPWEQVVTRISDGVMVIQDRYKPLVQIGKGEKLKAERVPGGEDIYIVGAIDARSPASVLFGGEDQTVMHLGTKNRENYDFLFQGVHTQYVAKEVNPHWRERMGVRYVSGFSDSRIEMAGGGEVYLEDMPTKQYSYATKEKMEVGYASVLLYHNAKFLDNMQPGERVYVEVAPGGTVRHFVVAEKTPKGLRIWNNSQNLARFVGYDTGFGTEGVKIERFDGWRRVFDRAAALQANCTPEELRERLVSVRVEIPDDRLSIAERERDWKWRMDKGEISFTHTDHGETVFVHKADANELISRYSKLVVDKADPRKLRQLTDREYKPVDVPEWREFGLDFNNEKDVSMGVLLLAMSSPFFGYSEDEKPIVSAYQKRKPPGSHPGFPKRWG